MAIDNLTNEITKFAASNDGTFGFTAAGGTIDIISGSSRAMGAANGILSSLNNAKGMATEAGLAMGVAATASLSALGEFSPMALGMAGMAGIVSSISKGTQRS